MALRQILIRFRKFFMCANFFTDGSDLSTRVERYSTSSGYCGENISYRAGSGMETVLRLVVDDGVKSRGHRDNIFNDNFKLMGVGLHSHPTWDNCVVLDYAGGITSKKSSKKKEENKSYGKFKAYSDKKSDIKDIEEVKFSD